MIVETIFFYIYEKTGESFSSFYQCINAKVFRCVGFMFHGKILAMLLCYFRALSKDSLCLLPSSVIFH